MVNSDVSSRTVNTLQLQFLILIVAGWVNLSQHEIVAYLQEENRVLRGQLDTLVTSDALRRALSQLSLITDI